VTIKNLDFFQEIEHRKLPWRESGIYFPFFYYDSMRLVAQFLAPMERVKALLPSKRMHPLRINQSHSVVSISAYEYRDCDIEPYKEVGISIPVTLDEVSPLSTGISQQVPDVPKIYIHHLPVTTEIARDAGIELAGYPKFLASITFEKKGDWISCHLDEGKKHIFTLSGRNLELQPVGRSRIHALTVRGRRILRCEFILSEREEATSANPSDVRLELGDHTISQELKDLRLGKVISYKYSPQAQAILTSVIESFAA
jgi:hypothetical protein